MEVLSSRHLRSGRSLSLRTDTYTPNEVFYPNFPAGLPWLDGWGFVGYVLLAIP